jgi:TonB family protein
MTGANLLAWSLQIALLVAAAALALLLLRLKIPAARLLYWQIALLACLSLPLLRPWRQDVVGGDVSVSTLAFVRPAGPPRHHTIPARDAVLWLLAAGALARGAFLAAGFWHLRQYRRHSRPLGTREGVHLLLAEGIAGPVTFGAVRPVVLLPAPFPAFEPAIQEAILRHELLHVRRRDWLFTVAEEVVRAVFWFHPAIWWVLGEIGLAREQEVDRRVVSEMRSREAYVDALLSIAGATTHLDLAPAPLFLRKRHLKHRVVSILKEVRMSKTRLISSLAAALGVLVAACWLVTATFPLAADSADSPGISVDLGGATLLHRPPVLYPEAARKLGIQGTVVVQLKLDSSAEVSDALVVSGPDELRKEALRSVLNWHFAADAAGTTRVVSISFQADAAQTAPAPPVPPRPLQKIQVGGNVQSTKLIVQPKPAYPPDAKQARLQGVVKLHAIIGVDGAIENLSVISGHPLLVPSALEAVRQWVYSPTYLNGNPTEVETEIDVNYTLAK